MFEKKIPFKNYIILSIILIFTIIIAIYLFKLYGIYQESDLNIQIMDKYLRTINYNEIDNYLIENKNIVLYAGSSNDKLVRDFEKKFKKIIANYSLNNIILYLNTNTSENKNLTINNEKINIPAIIVYKDAKITSIFDIQKNKYDINLLTKYLKEEMIIND